MQGIIFASVRFVMNPNATPNKQNFIVVQSISPDLATRYEAAAASVEPPVGFNTYDLSVPADEKQALKAYAEVQAQNASEREGDSPLRPYVKISPEDIVKIAKEQGHLVIKLARPEGALDLSYFWLRVDELSKINKC